MPFRYQSWKWAEMLICNSQLIYLQLLFTIFFSDKTFLYKEFFSEKSAVWFVPVLKKRQVNRLGIKRKKHSHLENDKTYVKVTYILFSFLNISSIIFSFHTSLDQPIIQWMFMLHAIQWNLDWGILDLDPCHRTKAIIPFTFLTRFERNVSNSKQSRLQ